MQLQLYCVTYEVLSYLDGIHRQTYVWARDVGKAKSWVKRYWWRHYRCRIDITNTNVVQPVDGGIVATVWTSHQ